MNQRHILFDTDKTAFTENQGDAPQKDEGRQLADAQMRRLGRNYCADRQLFYVRADNLYTTDTVLPQA